MELVCTVTQDCDCPVEGDLLFWLVVNKFKKNYEGTSFCICSAYMCVYKVQFCIVLLTCSVFSLCLVLIYNTFYSVSTFFC